MIYSTRNRSNDATESQKEKDPLIFNCSFSVQSFKKEPRDYLRCDQ